MSTLFTAPFRARWVDMDFNQHMRTRRSSAWRSAGRTDDFKAWLGKGKR